MNIILLRFIKLMESKTSGEIRTSILIVILTILAKEFYSHFSQIMESYACLNPV